MEYGLIETAPGYLEGFPPIDVKATEKAVNALFRAYIFFRDVKGERIICTSCCGEKAVLPSRTMTPEMNGILTAAHNEEAVCPYCGKKVTVKNELRLGKKKRLIQFEPVLILSEKDGDLYARGYWARKDYARLTDPPKFMLAGAYWFTPGRAEETREDWFGRYYTCALVGNYDPVHRVITEPFTEPCYGGYRYIDYTVLGLDAIGRSSFRYCGYEKFRGTETRCELMKYLAACCIYPRQIEMLMKNGMEWLVSDLVTGRKKNTEVIKWGENDPKKAFGMSAEELKAMLTTEGGPEMAADYKKLRRAKLLTGFRELADIRKKLGYFFGEYIRLCLKFSVKPERVLSYLERFTGTRCWGGRFGEAEAFRMWKDYTDAAAELGRDLTVETVLMPRDLEIAHDEVTKEITLRKERLKAQEDRKLREMFEASIVSRRKKYNFDLDGWFIRVAEGPEEIVAEGKTLCHCVGGYAERHMKGRTTILFLRRCSAPSVSCYTIEMHGNTMQQIHGYKNERIPGTPDPNEKMAWILRPWLDWVRAGSRRRKADGTPIIKRIREEKTA